MQVVFRTDASRDIGTGHVIRCLTLAEALRGRQHQCHFICRDLPGNLSETIAARGFAVSLLAPRPIDANPITDIVPHAAMFGVDWAQDAADTATVIARLGRPVHWLVVDHYGLDARWEETMCLHSQRLFVVDDLADRKHRCDALLDQNIGRHPGDYGDLVAPSCRLLTGPAFAILRPEFAALRDAALARRFGNPVRNMLISMGGVDRDNATEVVLAGLNACTLPPDLEITVVMGQGAPWLERVREYSITLPWRTNLLTDVRNMADLMAAADICVGAAGTTTWERCCLGLPSVVLGVAENQRYVLGEMAAQNVAVIDEVDTLRAEPTALAPLIARLLDDRAGYVRRSAAKTDGRGIDAILAMLEAQF